MKPRSSHIRNLENPYLSFFLSTFSCCSFFSPPSKTFSKSSSKSTMLWMTMCIGLLLLLASQIGLVSGQYEYDEYEYEGGHDEEPALPHHQPPYQSSSRTNEENGAESCYDHHGRARKCTPEFVNAAFSLPVEATNVCGKDGPQVYCLQVGVRGASKSCHYCDARHVQYDHSPKLMTDYEGQGNWTWWQSETMLKDVQYPHSVNLTLHLQKSFDITYVSIRFHSSRPESFAIYKRDKDDGEWIPYQFYSASCERTYDLRPRSIITTYDESKAICTDEFSDISPLSGGTVVFSTLEGRPSSRSFDTSKVLQDFVTATDIRITLNRINTFRDEVFGDPQVLRSYFYAISDIAIGARCKCNGHAKACPKGADDQMKCQCEHNTMGVSCQMCNTFFNDRPWKRATETDAHECLQCNCNGKSRECVFNETLYQQTGHGGYCTNCADNTDGPNCDQCKVNHFLKQPEHRCMPCNCNPTGSIGLQCNVEGKCQCKPGVAGDQCDHCKENHYDFTDYGCSSCQCLLQGSSNNTPYCDPASGKCSCKENVDGQKCDRCKNGFFGMEESNPFGCIACFCYGHSSSCQSANGYYGRSILSQFSNGRQRWTAADRSNQAIPIRFDAITKKLGVIASGNEIIYFLAPERYLHDQRFSYNQFFSFKLRVGDSHARPSRMDVVLESTNGQMISTPIFSQSNPTPAIREQSYKFRLHEHPNYQWQPRLRSQDFIALLSNLTAIKIKGTYNTDGAGFIDDVRLETAGYTAGRPASWVEQCSCPDSYLGENCQSCSPGYRRDPPNGGPFARCILCECNGHSDDCDVNTGRCICKHNTVGRNCESCMDGYYGNAKAGTADDCEPCPCPNNGTCEQFENQDIVCTSCPEGYGGDLCNVCLDGFYGDPDERYGPKTPCQPCPCNGNIDLNAVGNCNSTTGECLGCIYNTGGFYCGNCLPNYYGNALAKPKGQCKACNCYTKGTLHTGVLTCNQENGQCPCHLHVEGFKCDSCTPGYWNLDSGKGCESCSCDPVGSTDSNCTLTTGQCKCKENIGGKRCDKCQPYHFGFSPDGCKRCQCDPLGSLDQQCDSNGICNCRPTTTGDRCNQCQENKYNIVAGCIDCPPCYTLVQEQVNEHRQNLRDIRNYTEVIKTSPQAFNDSQFLERMKAVSSSVEKLINDARRINTGNSTFGKQLNDLNNSISDIMDKCSKIASSVAMADSDIEQTQRFIKEAQDAITRAEMEIDTAQKYIKNEGEQALRQARSATEKFGKRSEEMKTIAINAKQIADRQMMEAEEIKKCAEDSLNTSSTALELAEEMFEFPNKLATEISRLISQNENNKNLYRQSVTLSENAKKKAEQALSKALGINLDIGKYNLSNVNVDPLITEAKRIRDEAETLRMTVDKALEANRNILDEVNEEKKKVTFLYEEALNKQQEADKLMANVFQAYTKAKAAAEKGEGILKEAQETLKTLQNFDKNVGNNKKEAEQAMKKVEEIKNIITKAETKTNRSEAALQGADKDAKEALSIAKDAKGLATDASKEAGKFRQDAEAIKNKAAKIADKTDSLAEDVNQMNLSMSALEKNTEEDSEAVNTASSKASQASNNADEALDKITKARNTLDEINSILNNLNSQNVNTTHLDILEREIETVEAMMSSTDIENQVQKITEAIKILSNSEVTLTRDLSELRADVDNIRDIKDALPSGCFKPLNLESGD